MSAVFRLPVRVYYEDTDSGGVVYYANYLKFFERARTEWLRSLGFEQNILRDEYGILFAVRQVEVDYLKPAVFNDKITVSSTVEKIKKASLVFTQTIMREQTILVKATIKIACITAAGFKPAAIPAHVLTEITNAS